MKYQPNFLCYISTWPEFKDEYKSSTFKVTAILSHVLWHNLWLWHKSWQRRIWRHCWNIMCSISLGPGFQGESESPTFRVIAILLHVLQPDQLWWQQWWQRQNWDVLWFICPDCHLDLKKPDTMWAGGPLVPPTTQIRSWIIKIMPSGWPKAQETTPKSHYFTDPSKPRGL